MTAPYKHMTRPERFACLGAAVLAIVCLAIVATTSLGPGHNVAVVLGPLMAAVVGLIGMRNQRRRE